MLDIGLNIAVVLVMIALSWFGISATERRRRSILAVCLFGVVLVGAQAYRNWKSQQELQGTIGGLKTEIQNLRAALPKPHVPAARLRVSDLNVVQMGIGQVTKVDVHVENSGDAPAEELSYVPRFMFVFSSPTSPGEDAVFADLYKEMSAAPKGSGSMAPGGKVFFTVDGPKLGADDFVPRDSPPGSHPQVSRKGKALLLAGLIRYKSTGVSKDPAEFCVFVMNPLVRILCNGHNR